MLIGISGEFTSNSLYLIESFKKWVPVPDDGVFYQTNAFERYLNGDLNTGFELHISFNSYEGSLTEAFYSPYVPIEQSTAFIADIFR